MDPNTEKPPFAQWAIVEVMGHVTVAGWVSEEILFGTPLVRIDVPHVPEHRYTPRSYWNSQPPTTEVIEPAIAAHTVYYGPNSIYSLKPTTEEAARARAKQLRVKSIDVYLPADDTQEVPITRALPPGDDYDDRQSCDDEDDGDNDGIGLDYDELNSIR